MRSRALVTASVTASILLLAPLNASVAAGDPAGFGATNASAALGDESDPMQATFEDLAPEVVHTTPSSLDVSGLTKASKNQLLAAAASSDDDPEDDVLSRSGVTKADSQVSFRSDVTICVAHAETPYITKPNGVNSVTISAAGTCSGTGFVQKLCIRLEEYDGFEWYKRSNFRCTPETVNWKTYIDAAWSCKSTKGGRFRTYSKHVAWKNGEKKMDYATGIAARLCD